MGDLISKQEVIKAMQESEFGYTFEVDAAIEAVKTLPTVEPEGMGKMSENLISRKEMIRAVDSLGEDYISYYKLLLLIGKMPSAEPERKAGKWMLYESRSDTYDLEGVCTWGRAYRCSECGFIHCVIEGFGTYSFCPNCGAKIEETK